MAVTDAATREKRKLKAREYRANNLEKVRAYQRQWRRDNYKKDPARDRAWWLHSNYRITVEEYDAMLAAQGGVCAICQRPETATDRLNPGIIRRLAVDHCHKTKKIRGLLCFKCNSCLGKLNDDPNIFRSAATYLERHTH